MALYSGSLKTQILDDISFSQNKIQFNFDADTMYYSNIRLVDLGMIGTATEYNPLGGVYSQIRNIRLLDGRKEISAMRNASRYLSFTNLLASNAENRDANHKMTKNEIGYTVDNQKQIVPGGAENPAAKTADKIDAVGLTASLGSLDLRRCIPILNKMNVLDTAMFENLKVEIEFETDLRNMVVSQAAGDQKKAQCLLLADEIIDPALQEANRKAMGVVVWEEIESDVFQVPDGSATGGALADTAVSKQTVNHKINGFNGKIVNKVVMMKSFSDKTKHVSANNVVGFGSLGSVVQLGEVVNCSLNGSRLFVSEGLKSDNEKLALLSDTWGDLNLAPHQQSTSVGLDNKHTNSVHKEGVEPLNGNDQSDKVGNASFIGYAIQDRVSDLQINYSRNLCKDTLTVQKYNLGLNVHVFAEVSKSFIPQKSGYIVKYN